MPRTVFLAVEKTSFGLFFGARKKITDFHGFATRLRVPRLAKVPRLAQIFFGWVGSLWVLGLVCRNVLHDS